MREILFRGRLTDKSRWVYGCLINNIYGAVPAIMTEQSVDDAFNLDFEYDHVEEKTVGQFTGLTDKNGKKIFEGDILEYTSYTGTGIKEVKRAVVFWDEHRWSYKVIYNNRWTAQWNNNGYTCDIYKEVVAKYGEVIGNIHDNPELLENP